MDKGEIKNYCVYVHRNKINGKSYVGQTCQTPPEKRWGYNGCGYKYNQYFTNSIQKYGWDNFEHEIVKTNLTKEEADDLEKLLIQKLNSMAPNGYNLKEGGSNGKMSEESKKKMSESAKGNQNCKGYKHTEEAKKKMSVKVGQYTKKYKLIKVWDSITEASKELDIGVPNICACCSGRARYAGVFAWEYYD